MTVSFPVDIVEVIISRLPIKSILRCRSVSKTWLSLISHPSFTKLQFTHSRTALFFSAYDNYTLKRYYFTAAKDGGPLTILMTVDNDTGLDLTERSHLKGLVCFTSRTLASTSTCINSHAFVVNPATRKVFQLPDMNCHYEYALLGYLYGFDESRNEHKILFIKNLFKTKTREFMIYSMSSYSWRKIDVEPPVGFDSERLCGPIGGGVCVNSVVHILFNNFLFDILAFDFISEKFSVISLPQGFFPDDDYYRTSITKIGGCLGVVLHDRDRNEFHVWWLQDYDKRVWVKETVKFPKSWNNLVGRAPPKIDVNMNDEIAFCLGKATKNGISIPVYNMKTKCFRFVEFTLDDQFASSKTVRFCHVSCYVETIMPLVDNWSKKSHAK